MIQDKIAVVSVKSSSIYIIKKSQLKKLMNVCKSTNVMFSLITSNLCINQSWCLSIMYLYEWKLKLNYKMCSKHMHIITNVSCMLICWKYITKQQVLPVYFGFSEKPNYVVQLFSLRMLFCIWLIYYKLSSTICAKLIPWFRITWQMPHRVHMMHFSLFSYI